MSGPSSPWRGLFELGMVFLGVMGASSWTVGRDHREARAQEILYLERLAVDLRQDSTTIDRGWVPGLNRKLDAMAVITPHARGMRGVVGDTLAFPGNVATAGAQPWPGLRRASAVRHGRWIDPRLMRPLRPWRRLRAGVSVAPVRGVVVDVTGVEERDEHVHVPPPWQCGLSTWRRTMMRADARRPDARMRGPTRWRRQPAPAHYPLP